MQFNQTWPNFKSYASNFFQNIDLEFSKFCVLHVIEYSIN